MKGLGVKFFLMYSQLLIASDIAVSVAVDRAHETNARRLVKGVTKLTVRAVRGGNVTAAAEEEVVEAEHARVRVNAAVVLLLVKAHAVRALGRRESRQHV